MNSECCLKNEKRPVCICANEERLSVLGKKWAVLILRIIGTSGTAGYNEVFRQISHITPKAFGDKLRILESKNLIARKIIHERPVRTEYALTPEGEKLLETLEPLFGSE